ncbi:MAG: sulfatase [Myxococcota bacterium]|nr:sulfatase [Myxococcota bacterium]
MEDTKPSAKESPKPVDPQWLLKSIQEERKELRRLMRPGTRTMVYPAPTDVKYVNPSALCSECDVILITVCSLRKDAVGLYQNQKNVTPYLNSVAKGGFYFDKAYATSNFTLGGLSSVLTGRFGISTGVTDIEKGLPKDVFTLPQILSYYGYQTAAFTIEAGSGFRPEHGLDRGFLRMEISPPPRNTPDGRWLDSISPPAFEGDGASAQPVADWLAYQPADKPLFAMFHTRTAHYPFIISQDEKPNDTTGMTEALWMVGRTRVDASQDSRARSGFGKGDEQSGGLKDPIQTLVQEKGQPAIDVLHEHYRSSVKRMDKDIKAVIEAQRSRGRLDKTMWVIVADHGESLYDHKELLHGGTFYETVINIPLIIKIPGLRGQEKSISSLVSQVDILPTVLDAVGAVSPANIDGTSILPLLQGKTDTIRKMTLAAGGAAPPKGELPGAIISPPWALLIHEGNCDDTQNRRLQRKNDQNSRCLYNLEQNPAQNIIFTDEEPEKVKELDNVWKYFVHTRSKKGLSVDLDPTFVQELRRAGYDFR